MSDRCPLGYLFLLQARLQSIAGTDRELVCDADRHFYLGRTILMETARCLKECSVFVAVVSTNFCSSRYCQLEVEKARILAKPIILIFKEHVDERHMSLATKEVFDTFARAKFVYDENGEPRIQPDWDHICESSLQLM